MRAGTGSGWGVDGEGGGEGVAPARVMGEYKYSRQHNTGRGPVELEDGDAVREVVHGDVARHDVEERAVRVAYA